jgi:hypothetical protein
MLAWLSEAEHRSDYNAVTVKYVTRAVMRNFVYNALKRCEMSHRAIALLKLRIICLRARGHTSRPFTLACES